MHRYERELLGASRLAMDHLQRRVRALLAALLPRKHAPSPSEHAALEESLYHVAASQSDAAHLRALLADTTHHAVPTQRAILIRVFARLAEAQHSSCTHCRPSASSAADDGRGPRARAQCRG